MICNERNIKELARKIVQSGFVSHDFDLLVDALDRGQLQTLGQWMVAIVDEMNAKNRLIRQLSAKKRH